MRARVSVFLTLVLCLLIGTAAAEAPSLSAQVEEIALDNGLRIFVLERDFSPTFAAYYEFGVGGAADPKGRSGIAHLLEHMMFKGTENLGSLNRAKEKKLMARLTALWHELDSERAKVEQPFAKYDAGRVAELEAQIESVSAEQKALIVKNEYDELMTRAGGSSMNASTSWDRTNYFLQLPANQLEFWFQREADRLVNPVFREFYSERDVVHEERRMRYENRAEGLAMEAMNGLLWRAHPYNTPVIGWPKDISQLKREDAEAYFTTYYSPSNCTMVLVGDLDRDEVAALAKKYLSKWKRQELPQLQITTEPEQSGARRQVVSFDAEPNIDLGWVSIPAGHADEYPFEILSGVLGGMNSSRLEQKIVQESRIASSVSAGNYSGRYSGSFEMGGRPTEGHEIAELEAAMIAEIRSIQENGVTDAEVERAKVATEVQRIRRLESNLYSAFTIGVTVGSTGRVAYMDEYARLIDAVTADDVQRVARDYLLPEKMCAVEIRRSQESEGGRPGRAGGGVEHGHGAPPGDRGAAHSKGFRKALAKLESAAPVAIVTPEIGVDVERRVLPSGITVFIKEERSLPTVAMSLRWRGGSNTLPIEELAKMEFASDLLNEGGTESLEPAALEVRRDELGLSFSVSLGETSSSARFWSLKRNFDESFDLAVDILKRPRLDKDRLDVIKGQHIAQMKRRYDNPRWAVGLLTDHVFYGDDPRLGHTTSKSEVEALTTNDVLDVIQRYLGSDNLTVTVVGDFDKEEMLRTIETKLGDWRPAGDTRREWIAHPRVVRPGAFLLEKDLPQPSISIRQELDVDRADSPEEHAALEILDSVLGGSGFRSRLMERLRSDEGLTYGIYSRTSHEGREGVPGALSIGYQTKRDAVARSIASVLEVYETLMSDGATEQEIAEQIQTWRNGFIFRFTSPFYSVSRLAEHELDDRPYDRDRQQLAQIQRVDVAAVKAVAKKYLDSKTLSICIFGSLTEADEAAIDGRFGLTKLSKDEVFKGGY